MYLFLRSKKILAKKRYKLKIDRVRRKQEGKKEKTKEKSPEKEQIWTIFIVHI